MGRLPGLPGGSLSVPSAPNLGGDSPPPDRRPEDLSGEIKPSGEFGPGRGNLLAGVGAAVDKGDDARSGSRETGAQGASFQGRPGKGGKLGNQALPGGLVEPVLGGDPEQVKAVRQQGHDPEGRATQVKDRIGKGHGLGQNPPGFFGGHGPVRDEDNDPEVSGDRQADGLGVAVGLEGEDDPAQHGRGGIIRMSFDGGGEPEELQDLEAAAGHQVGQGNPGDGGGRTASQTPFQGNIVPDPEVEGHPFCPQGLQGLAVGPDDQVLLVRRELRGPLTPDGEPKLWGRPGGQIQGKVQG